ncbi:Mus81p Ecym_2318 [Eremothecium cymbalariae DBVPG|uniref:Crossover junction endonuclease MUS81 n=1 Tax=Eremothecium cymbalariae (strain CBS 270.75 / DBVPG 7215 / KCTC 17166 / NRRL Y-17582) TaxID=931890 RepID=G8JQ58_ERECY|nr:Hypothetical protein Ecym_2318 [Eremothecium cymbalariae DBVPG\
MSFPSDLKQLFIKWLEEEIANCGPRKEKVAMVYFRACESLRKYESAITETNQLLKVKGIGNAIKNMLSKHLDEYYMRENIPKPSNHIESEDGPRSRIRVRATNDESGNEDGSPKKKKRSYVPRKRSGAYAILLAMLQLGSPSSGLTKEEIVEVAAKYCDASFISNPLTREYHSAWNSIKILIERNLVLEQGRPRRYVITGLGQRMAETLKEATNVTFPEDSSYYKKKVNENSLVDEKSENTVNLSELIRTRRVSVAELDTTQSFIDKSSIISNTSAVVRRMHTIAYSSPKNVNPRSSSPLKGYKDGIIKARWGGVSYELWECGQYDVKLYIDHREVRSKSDRDFFVNALATRGIAAEGKVLALGDIIWVAKHKASGKECVLNFLLERKRLDDLSMSIKDNRFMEQKNRLKKTKCKHIFYLIEETSASELSGMEDALKTSIWMTAVYNNFHIKRTKNADETVEWLHNMTHSIIRYYKKKTLLLIRPKDVSNQDDYGLLLSRFRGQFERNGSRIECCHGYNCFQEVLGKTNMMTVKELYLRTLMLTRGVSLEKAIAIQSKFPTLKALLLAYLKCSSEEEGREMVYNELIDQPASRKIGKALSDTLWNTFGKK